MDKLQEINQQVCIYCAEKNKEKEKILNLVCEALQNASDTYKKNKLKMNSITIAKNIYSLFTPCTWIKLKRKYKLCTIWVVISVLNDGLYKAKLDKKGNISKECIYIQK